jgi:phage I-like protein
MSTPKPTHSNDIVRIDAYELADTSAELRAVKLSAVDGGPAPRPRSWIQVAKLGAFKGHAMGPFEFTEKVFERIIENFERTSNREVPVDFEHATEMPACDGDIATHGAPATGWIIQLANRGASGLWGLVEWLEPGLSYVREGRYRYFSPAVVFNYRDGRSGESVGPVLVSGGLTNRPFLDGMAPVTARVAGVSREESDNMKIEELIKVLSLALGDEGKGLTVENVGERVTDVTTRMRSAEETVTTLNAEKAVALKAAAEGEVDEVIKLGLVANTAEARKDALDVRMSQPKAFASMFSARVEAARKTSGKGAERKTGNGPDGTGAAITATEEKTLTTPTAPTGGNPPERKVESAVEMRLSDKVHEKAVALMNDKPDVYRAKKHGVPNAQAYVDAENAVLSEMNGKGARA